jgi:uncharacterized damage-inducible protein DinB
MSQPVTALYQLTPEMPRQEVVKALAAMPGRVAAALRGLSAESPSTPRAAGAWSAFQVLCHMRDAAIVYSGRFRWMVFDESPILPNYDEDNWVAASVDTVDDLDAILAELRASRTDLVRILERIPDAAWRRTGRHEVLGVVTLEPYVRHQLAHEEIHLAQLESALRG